MSVRDELVSRVRFLQHPKVQDTPLSERLLFLEKKGLTPKEELTLELAPDKNVEAQIQELEGATPAKVYEGELQSWSFVDATYAAIAKEFGRIDFVVNCVPAPKDSAVKPTALVDVEAAAWDEVMGVSAKAVFLSCKRAVQQMLTQDNGAVRGRIVNISSLYGWSRWHCVNAVAPGFIDDSISREDCLAPATNNRIPAEEPGKAMDVANAVTFLVSDDARYVHGINLLVDGGFMAC
ncbi:NAD(P)-binding domain [Phytophthora cactorum]|nr:NAD(P)-binding domain [Phytophthora cactorum]